jgi:hypothetical protein
MHKIDCKSEQYVHLAFPANNMTYLLDMMAIYMYSEGNEEPE